MNILAVIFCSISLALMIITLPVMLWQFVIGIFGLLPMKKDRGKQHKWLHTSRSPISSESFACKDETAQGADETMSCTASINNFHRFAVVICARNEETVLGCLIDSLKAQTYPRDCFDIFVAADNCTDDTAEIARRHGAIVYERFNHQLVGKGYTLRWLLDRIQADYPSVYTAVTVFDADNLADSRFLEETNRALCSGADVVKGYRQVKNLGDSWVSDSYAIYWLSMMRFFHHARANCGLSCFVDGTGFSFKTELIQEEGWNTSSMVEDCEFSMKQICKGYKFVPLYSAIYYDEQPVTFSLSLRQRFRWTVGCVQCIPYCLPSALQALCIRSSDKKLNRRMRWEALDVIMYLLLIPCVGINLIAGLFGFAAMLVGPPPIVSSGLYYSFSFLSMAISWLSLSAGAGLTLWLDKFPLRKFLRAIILFPIFIWSMAYMAVIAVFYPKAAWKPIAHNCQTNIQDLADKS